MSHVRPAVLIDVDGTLVDTNWLHVVAWSRVFTSAGHDVPMARIHPLVGLGASELIEAAIGRRDEDLKQRHADEFDTFRDEIRALPKAAELLREIRRRGAAIALCTSAQKAHADPMREAIGADDAITEIIDGDDVERSKPDPGVFTAALDKLGCGADRAIAVGDTRWDMEAAANAGIPVVGVLSGGVPRQDLDAAGAVAVYEDVAELLASLDDRDSPLGRLLRQND